MATEAKVSLSYPLENDWQQVQKQLEKIAKKHNGKNGSSGAGLGMRDMDFLFATYKEAVAAEKAMKAIKIEGIDFY